MLNFNEISNFVAEFEGCSSSVEGTNTPLTNEQINDPAITVYPYNDGYGNYTQGYGSCFDLRNKAITENSPPITNSEAKMWLSFTLRKYLNQLFTNNMDAFNKLTQQQANAFGSLVYNVGVENVSNSQLFKQFLAENYGTITNYNTTAGTMAYNWASEVAGFNKVNGVFNQSLENRRISEINMFFNGN